MGSKSVKAHRGNKHNGLKPYVLIRKISVIAPSPIFHRDGEPPRTLYFYRDGGHARHVSSMIMIMMMIMKMMMVMVVVMMVMMM